MGLVTGEVQQWTREADAARVHEVAPHPLQRPASRAPREPEQHGLGLVVEGVPEEHEGRTEVRCQLGKRRVAGLAGTGFEPRRARVDGNPDGCGLVDPQDRHLLDHGDGVLGGPVLERVVDGDAHDAGAGLAALEDARRQEAQ